MKLSMQWRYQTNDATDASVYWLMLT